MFALGYWYTATHLNLGISFDSASIIRVTQMVSIPFVFISVTTAAYFGLPSERTTRCRDWSISREILVAAS